MIIQIIMLIIIITFILNGQTTYIPLCIAHSTHDMSIVRLIFFRRKYVFFKPKSIFV